MKFHWGHGIFLFYLVFVIIHIGIVIKSRTFDNSLVTEDYYARDINYQQEYDRRSNSLALSEPVAIVDLAGTPALQFPQDMAADVEGTVLLYRPSSRHNDRLLPLKLNSKGLMPLNTTGMKPGKYTAVVEWKKGSKGFYDEIRLDVKRP